MHRELVVDGMTCRACEKRIQRALCRVDGVESATADAATGRVHLTLSRDVANTDLAAAIAAAGEDYRLGTGAPKPWLTRDRRVWRDLAVALLAVAALVLLARATGLTSLADRVGTEATSGSLLVVALLGVAAGFSTCMALVGGLVLAFSARAAAGTAAIDPTAAGPTDAAARPTDATAGPTAPAARPTSGGTWRRWAPHIAFNGGRVVGFAALGALTGLLGSAVTLSGVGLALAMLAVAVVMTLLGIQLSGVSPRLAGGLLPTLPDVLSSRLQRTADRPTSTGRTAATAAVVGAGTYLLPCGFTQAVQLYALSTGSPGRGAAIMAAFALGTTPGLLAIAGLSVGLRGAWAVRFGRFAAVAVLAFAVVNATGALGILRGGVTGGPSAADAVSANVRVEDGVQYVRTAQVANGYEPATAVVAAGVPVVWQVTSEAMTCASWLDAPDLGVPPETVLIPGETSEFRFTPERTGTIRYSCGMGMYWGSFRVIEAPDAPTARPA
jgi:sulfite exporter TauE/SafE/copper chaperone CopZ